MYHDVSDTPPNDIYRAPLNVTPDVFSAQMDYLECAGYTAITPSRIADAIAGRGALPPKPVILTFDDGYANQYTDAFPILKRHGMTGAFSIITGYAEAGGEYMTWSQIETMAGAGMEMMSHTVTHIDLNVADDATVLGQLRDSRSAIAQHTGRAPAFLVYPSGEPFRSGTERQAQIVSMAAAAGYSAAFLAGPASATQDPSHPFQFNRLRVEGSIDLVTFAAMVGGPPPADCAGLATPAPGRLWPGSATHLSRTAIYPAGCDTCGAWYAIKAGPVPHSLCNLCRCRLLLLRPLPAACRCCGVTIRYAARNGCVSLHAFSASA
jgi:peptidoglycan/xylan/chitin deacetylase (PgdA/CDA1 family)